MTDQPNEMSEARAELQQEDLGIVDEESLTATTNTNNERVDDEASGPLTEQPDATSSDEPLER